MQAGARHTTGCRGHAAGHRPVAQPTPRSTTSTTAAAASDTTVAANVAVADSRKEMRLGSRQSAQGRPRTATTPTRALPVELDNSSSSPTRQFHHVRPPQPAHTLGLARHAEGRGPQPALPNPPPLPSPPHPPPASPLPSPQPAWKSYSKASIATLPPTPPGAQPTESRHRGGRADTRSTGVAHKVHLVAAPPPYATSGPCPPQWGSAIPLPRHIDRQCPSPTPPFPRRQLLPPPPSNTRPRSRQEAGGHESQRLARRRNGAEARGEPNGMAIRAGGTTGDELVRRFQRPSQRTGKKNASKMAKRPSSAAPRYDVERRHPSWDGGGGEEGGPLRCSAPEFGGRCKGGQRRGLAGAGANATRALVITAAEKRWPAAPAAATRWCS